MTLDSKPVSADEILARLFIMPKSYPIPDFPEAQDKIILSVMNKDDIQIDKVFKNILKPLKTH